MWEVLVKEQPSRTRAPTENFLYGRAAVDFTLDKIKELPLEKEEEFRVYALLLQ
jgi:hypothetical protein